ncbi:tRNA-uridine aminocarboxypropyltransferase 1-like [Amphiura filiformis]|uniref:tRNA-uridine aminocarboxypropyltransferase 1-like n=1 Tax=Amphiura filiformis TaxID=82378 RepID=UPI003B21D75F
MAERQRTQSGDDPFAGLNIDSHESLENIKDRSFCPKCHASRKYFCYTCIIPMPEVASSLPTVSLPVHIDIIKHPREIDGKSTAVHAAIIAPNDVTIYTYPDIPQFEDKAKVLLVYPTDNAVTLKDLVKMESSSTNGAAHSESHIADTGLPPQPKRTKYAGIEGQSTEGVRQFERVVFIDSTWNQSNQIFRDERLQDLQCVILKTQKTHFWRTQPDKPDTYLATIEAIYYFTLEYHQEILATNYQGQYDNLLYFFSFMYKLVQKSTAETEGLSKEEKQVRHRRRTETTTLEAQLRRQKSRQKCLTDLSVLIVN